MTSEAMQQPSGEASREGKREARTGSSEESTQQSALHDYMNSAVEQTGKMLKAMGEKVRVLADSVRDEAGAKRRVRRVAERVAQRLESSGEYLATGSSERVGDQISNMVRQYPLRSVGACLMIGWLVGTAARRREM